MDRIVGIISAAPQTRSANDDDLTDRLSSRYTVVLLVGFAILVSMNQYVRDPITCWAPVHFTGAHIKFATSYCWVKNTYYVPWDQQMPLPWQTEQRQVIPYYQWIPFILLGQAVFFYLPTVIWHGLNSKAGVDSDNILAAAHLLSRTDKVDARERTLNLLSNQFDRFLESRSDHREYHCDVKSMLSATLCRFCGRRLGNYLVMLFLFSKACYILNIVAQFFVLNRLLGTQFNSFGLDIAKYLSQNYDWAEESSYVAFPRVTYCDFRIRGQDLGNTQLYSLQCVLPINLYNEKIYLFLWYWMLFLAAASIISFIIWFIRSVMFIDHLRFVRNHLHLGGRDPEKYQDKLVRKFVFGYLRLDGEFLMRLIAHNTNNVTTTEIVCAVWDSWLEKHNNVEPENQYPGNEMETLPLKES